MTGKGVSKSGAAGAKKESGYRRFFNREQLAGQAFVFPGILWYVIFCYVPMYGIVLAFKDYSSVKGILGSDWINPWYQHFVDLFADPDIFQIIFNTVAIGSLKLLFCFPMALLFALLVNEVRNRRFKKFVQTVSFYPYFVSWVVLVLIVQLILEPRNGLLNTALKELGLIERPLTILSDANAFYGLAVFSTLWKETGWSAIIFISAMTNVDDSLHEAAMIDGASKLQRILNVTIPAIQGTIILMFLLNFSGIFSGGSGTFDQSFLLGTPRNFDRSYVLSYYVMKTGISQGHYDFATAVGLLNSTVSMVLLLGSNFVCKRATGQGLFTRGGI